MTSTAFVTIEQELARLKNEVEEAKKRGEFEYAFMLLDKIESLSGNSTKDDAE